MLPLSNETSTLPVCVSPPKENVLTAMTPLELIAHRSYCSLAASVTGFWLLFTMAALLLLQFWQTLILFSAVVGPPTHMAV